MSAIEIDPREEPAEQDLSTMPGLRLREAREKAKLSVEDVSAALRLDLHLVEALEKDDYANLPTPTFVRGYLRGYARMLNLPEAPIIEAYNRHGFDSPQLVADITTRPQVKSGDMPVRIVTYSVVIVMLLLMVLWWQTQSGNGSVLPGFSFTNGPDTGTDTSSPAAFTLPGHEQTDGPGSGTSAMTDAGAMQEPVPADLDMPAGAPDAGARSESLTAEELAAWPQPVEYAPPAESDLEPAPEGTPGPAPVAEPVAATPGVGSLVIRLNNDSWTEIYDADKERLFYGTARKGNTLSVKGRTPLRLLIGNAGAVEIEYNGQPFDHTPFTDKGVARFSLGQ